MVRTSSLILLVGLIVIGLFSVFKVDEREKAILFRLGELVDADFSPGLHFKFPFINNVRKFDSRIVTLDAEPERFLTSEKKNVSVDSFVKWRIADVGRFYTSVAGDQRQANLRLDQIVKNAMRAEFSKRTINEAVSGDRSQVMRIVTDSSNVQAQEMGIEIVDVRIKRIDLPIEVSSSVYRRMEAERARVARDFRSRGAEAAERIRADADRQHTVILAEAYRDAEQTRGEGDAISTDTYAKAYGKNPEFYAFYRSLNAYKTVFSDANDLLVIEPDSEFFKYFKDQFGADGAN
ncbi:MAG TPA: protease modulator HflC [Chromatiaceae bacterium]|jgi:membrane protease subunit HflC|nr:protease modulator HflC [Chromatiaceae bacterium]HIN81433.1 protease modulator HflC [Chromatiales bacterium]HIA09172.1 protease modulator HflC [Chromatiaceae bacterium]HIB84831.1 protease modulator HflC [Chromatiaceae bacterium]HIO14681.1 protease modulator HflC [Chromatiales bacterium]